MRLGLLGLGAVCVFFTAKELFPGRMSALSLFSEVFEKLQNHEEVMVMTGHNMKAFGRDVGRNTEGRRNHVDSYSYTAEDGSSRLRIRMNIKGEKGKVIVWAEVRALLVGVCDRCFLRIVRVCALCVRVCVLRAFEYAFRTASQRVHCARVCFMCCAPSSTPSEQRVSMSLRPPSRHPHTCILPSS
jgi:hypothetical protein